MINWSGCIEIRIPSSRMECPIRPSSSEKCSCHGALHTGCDANGMISDEMRKKSISCVTFHAIICRKQERLLETVAKNLSSLKEASRNFLALVQSRRLLMQGYPIRISPTESC